VRSNSVEGVLKPKFRISASLVAAPWLELSNTIKDLESIGIEMLHFDIEDGHFSPNLSLGIKLISELRPITDLIFDVHLMIDNPELFIDNLATIGVDRIAVHWEATHYPLRMLQMIKCYKIKAGLAFNPATQIPDLTVLFPFLDFVNLLSTEPLTNNSEFISSTLNKLKCGREKYLEYNLEWVIDGGVTDENLLSIMACPTDIVVIGRYLFEGTPREKINQLNKLITEDRQ
jgi:ribulose-phosphate 3-epimerase